ncbi:MAG: glycosyltransferase family 2 protein, partial [Candidatus Omnitrophica bacterium]|nr:glycosyltransferase family 2 protein [Candidatus Omnitrophota bacterium]
MRLLKLSRQPAFMVPKDGGKSAFWVGLTVDEEREKLIKESKDRENDGGLSDKKFVNSVKELIELIEMLGIEKIEKEISCLNREVKERKNTEDKKKWVLEELEKTLAKRISLDGGSFDLHERFVKLEKISPDGNKIFENKWLKWQVILTLLTSSIIFSSIIFSLGFSVVNIIFSIFVFYLSTIGGKIFWGNLFAFVSKEPKKVLKKAPYRRKFCSNEISSVVPLPLPPLIIVIPFKDCSNKIALETLQRALREREDYQQWGGRCQIIAIDDDINLENKIEGKVLNVEKLEGEIKERVKFYRENKIAFVVTSKGIDRKGKFGKPIAMNYMRKIAEEYERIKTRENFSELREDLVRKIIEERGYFEGDLSFPEEGIILLLDKDTYLSVGVSKFIMNEFLKEKRLAYLQCHCCPYNIDENYFAKIVGFLTKVYYDMAFPLSTFYGSVVPLVGHAAYLRKEFFQWNEKRVSEDLSLEIDLVQKGFYGRYIDLPPHLTFYEYVSNNWEEEVMHTHRYVYGAMQFFFNPPNEWIRKGILTSQIKNFLKSSSLPWYVKIDLIWYLTGLFSHTLLWSMLFLITPFAPIHIAGIVFPQITFTGLGTLVYLIHKKEKKEEEKIKEYLKCTTFFGFSVISQSWYGVKGVFDFLLNRKPKFRSSLAGEELKKLSLKQAIWEEKSLILRNLGEIGIFGTLLYISPLTISNLAIFSFTFWVLGNYFMWPYLLNPTLMGALREKISNSFSFFSPSIRGLRQASLSPGGAASIYENRIRPGSNFLSEAGDLSVAGGARPAGRDNEIDKNRQDRENDGGKPEYSEYIGKYRKIAKDKGIDSLIGVCDLNDSREVTSQE